LDYARNETGALRSSSGGADGGAVEQEATMGFARRWAKVLSCVCVTTALGAAAGCAPKDDADRFRQALPAKDEVALKVPGSAGGSAGGSSTQSIRPLGGGPIGVTSSAEYYRFTRDITDAVDWTTAIILGAIEIVVHSPPTTIDAKHAVWGPGNGSALDPVVWRFTVTEVGTDEYDYALEGQRKGTTDFVAVLTGHGWGETRPEHKTGWFQADNDAFASLDPDRGHDTGTTKVTFDLTKLPRAIGVDLKPSPDKGFANIEVTHADAGAGSVEITALANIDKSQSAQLENVHLVSRWLSDGSGRADAELTGGDLPFTVDASECWSDTFTRVYYKDTVNYEPATGDASACSLAK
jgi:hypothetical protein